MAAQSGGGAVAALGGQRGGHCAAAARADLCVFGRGRRVSGERDWGDGEWGLALSAALRRVDGGEEGEGKGRREREGEGEVEESHPEPEVEDGGVFSGESAAAGVSLGGAKRYQ